jgi:hypothetical protein
MLVAKEMNRFDCGCGETTIKIHIQICITDIETERFHTSSAFNYPVRRDDPVRKTCRKEALMSGGYIGIIVEMSLSVLLRYSVCRDEVMWWCSGVVSSTMKDEGMRNGCCVIIWYSLTLFRVTYFLLP